MSAGAAAVSASHHGAQHGTAEVRLRLEKALLNQRLVYPLKTNSSEPDVCRRSHVLQHVGTGQEHCCGQSEMCAMGQSSGVKMARATPVSC